ncbi:right-handed parallel beta-helix repeat-containing protein [uncultured Agrobacterium sp.]|uniref:right-handed parallel beta-helix repeat-containing protein n=1 Tax=uncultured Agrobacterium sp. TaxID=157277 RepID=UPI0025D85CA5|nr:right-handed parallel beta-helix repeat-containing protein [uncultured Agrobacterium sp.]
MSKAAMCTAFVAFSMACVLPPASTAQDASSHLAPVKAQMRLSTAKFRTMLPIATIGAGEGLLTELENNIAPDVTAIVIESGSYALADLVAAIDEKGLQGAVTKSESTFTIGAPLVVWKGAELTIGQGEHVILDQKRSSLILNAGSMSLINASIEGSTSSEKRIGFRPFILTVADGKAVFNGSRIRNLGFGTFAETSGIAFLGRGYSMASADVEVSNNDITNLLSVSFIKSAKTQVFGNRLNQMQSSGIVLQSMSDVKVAGNVLKSTSGHGIRITSQSQKIALQDNTIVGSKAHGIFVDDGSVLVDINGNRVEKSGLSGIALRDSGCSVIARNEVVNNAQSGVLSEASFSVDVNGNSIVKNWHGITLERQSGTTATKVRDNTFDRNRVAIRSDGHGDLIIARNDFSRQWTRLFGGALASSTGRYLAFHDAGNDFDFVLTGEAKAATVQMASFSAFGLAECNSKL